VRRSFVWSLVVTLVLPLVPGAQTRPADQSPAELAQALQRKYDLVKDFSADFVHAYRGGVLNMKLTERGQLIVKKPGKMRWEYTAPERKLFVSDGVKFYSYLPDDKQVLMSAVPADDNAATPALFLAGKGNLTRDFVPSFAEVPADLPAGTRGLKLTPRTPQPDYDWLVLVVEPSTLALKGLVTVDAQGGTSSFSFTNLKENVGLADKAFDFKVPRGVDLITDPSLRR
jgi:outer membrane lipoprotein carrier protein